MAESTTYTIDEADDLVDELADRLGLDSDARLAVVGIVEAHNAVTFGQAEFWLEKAVTSLYRARGRLEKAQGRAAPGPTKIYLNGWRETDKAKAMECMQCNRRQPGTMFERGHVVCMRCEQRDRDQARGLVE